MTQGASLNDVIQGALRTAMGRYGWDLVGNSPWLRAVLNDICGPAAPDHRLGIDALAAAADAGVARELGYLDGRGRAETRSEMVGRLGGWGMSVEAAQWAVDTWAAVIPPAAGPEWTSAPPPVPGLGPSEQMTLASYQVAAPPADRQGPPTAPPARSGFGPAVNESPTVAAWPRPDASPPYVAVDRVPLGAAANRAAGRRRTRVWIAAGVTAALVAGLAVGGFVFLRGGDTERQLTSGARTVVDPAVALGTAEAIVGGIVTRRHGVKAADTRCYFSTPKTTVKNAKQTEIGQKIYCGPVLFVDGSSPAEYLQFVSRPQVSGNQVRLSVADTPVSAQPAAIPETVALIRPDGATPSISKLAAPRPQPATGGELLATADAAAMKAVNVGMGANIVGVRLAQLGTADRFGRGDGARSAPVGGKLIAFSLSDWFDCDTQCGAWRTAAVKVAVDAQPLRSLPAIVDGQHFVLAVAAKSRSVDLVMVRDGYTQRISLLTGTAAATNIKLLGNGAFPSAKINKSFAWKEHDSVRLSFGLNVTSDPNLAITVDSAYLKFFVYGHRPLSPDRAFLTVYASYSYEGLAGKFGFWTDQTRLETAGGAQYQAVTIKYKTYNYEVYEVPANITSAVFVIGGSHASKSTTGTPYTATIPIARIPVRLA